MADFDSTSQSLNGMNQSVAETTQVTAAFRDEMQRLQKSVTKTGYDISTLERGLSKGFRKALDGMLFDGMRMSDAMKSIFSSVSSTAYSAAMRPITDSATSMVTQGISALFGGMFANGGVMTGGRVTAFAKGGVLDGPTAFPMRGGMGLMGEAGPEAIMPLTRGPDGRLGVAARGGGGGRPINVTMNIQTPDAQGFQRSRSQIAAQMQRALQVGQRNS